MMRQIDSFSGLLAADLRDDFRSYFRHRIDRNRGFQLIQELSAAATSLVSISPIDAVADFGNRHRTESDRNLTNRLLYGLDGLFGRQLPPFCCDQDTGVEDYSQEGGFHG